MEGATHGAIDPLPLRAAAMRIIGSIVAAACVLMLGIAGWWHLNARAEPIERRAHLSLPDWPAGNAPVTVALISDIHIGNSTMDAARLDRIVTQIDRARPDLVLIAGDFVAGHDPAVARAVAPALVAPLARLRARLGVVAVLGNHDQSVPGTIRTALVRAGVTVLDNQAVARGPLAIGGVGDAFSQHDDLPATLRAMRPLRGARVIVTHSPDLSLAVPPGIGVLFAGHTHCGQGVFPLIGAPRVFWREGLICGLVRRGGLTTVITGGLGTSGVPMRVGAPPDLWLMTLGG
jgi:predicted MPP superfamily phosphohydrolase